jgi:hypothetical protein
MLFFVIGVIVIFAILGHFVFFSETALRSHIKNIPLPAVLGHRKKPWHYGEDREQLWEPSDAHPITLLMRKADEAWRAYEEGRSTTFTAAVRKYRNKYGRHPPPGFKDWYQYARERNVHNVDDFDQIMDDLRPFWAIEPRVIRDLAANMWKDEEQGIMGIHIRNHKVVKVNHPSWRSELMVTLIKKFIKYLPDMDIAANRLDQPRVVVPWGDMQSLLTKEADRRQMLPEVLDEFTPNMQDFLNLTTEDDGKSHENPEWYPAHGKQYMEIASTACPPESHARTNHSTTAGSEMLYKDRLSGVITNFNRSSDLCTVGPEIKNMHGFLFSSSSMIATKRLVPVFGECKVNVNSDILAPANMYWDHDPRYDYSGKHDKSWNDKKEAMIWRGVTSGGTQTIDNWRQLHRQRFVMLMNATQMRGKGVSILAERSGGEKHYERLAQFDPSEFASNYTDIGFTETWGCVPDCGFYDDIWTIKDQVPLPEQFQYKFLADVDGHSFSGRWRAFLESKSLGIKATIFREWHDSRLFAWRHFAPMDNRFDDIYTLLTYFIGLGTPTLTTSREGDQGSTTYVARHDTEANRIASQGREWAKKVLRRDDIEVSLARGSLPPLPGPQLRSLKIYMYRLLLEYARIVDDNRDRIGYSGDGSELDKYDGVSQLNTT